MRDGRCYKLCTGVAGTVPYCVVAVLMSAANVVGQDENGVAYDARGGEDHPTVVAIPGTFLDRTLWEAQLPLADEIGLRFVRMDPRGLGMSAPADGPYDPRRDVLTVAEASGPGPFCLIGQSNGGTVALDLYFVEPDRVRALVLFAPGVSGYEPPASDAERLRALGLALEASGHEAAVNLLLSDPYVRTASRRRDLQAVLRSVYEPNPTMWTAGTMAIAPEREALYRLDEVGVPTAVFVGDEDVPHMVDLSKRVAEEIPGAELHVVPGHGHLLPLEAPELVNPILSDFLARNCRR